MDKTLKILVVDDEEVDRTAIRLALIEAGICMDLCEVSDSSNAITTLQHAKYDCVFLDYCLPNQDTFTLIQKLHSSDIKVPLIILIVQGEEKIAVELIKAGATDYLDKSNIYSENLEKILLNAIRLHRAELQAALANQKLRESHEQLIRKNQELERQRQQIQLQNLKLMEASRLKSQFLATISHELRTPMNAIIGFSQILLRPKFGHLTHQQKDMIERILNNGKHLLMLLNEVLDFSKLESGKLELKPEIFDLTKVVHSTVAEIHSLAEAKKLSLLVQTNLNNNLVFNDPGRVRQILLNLLSNAVKFTESGSIGVEVRELPTNRITITVKDTGIGIAPKDYKHIFEAFRQVDQGITRRYPGTGLGLAIIDALVRMMGGKIFLESKVGAGSIFKIELPRQISVELESVDNSGLNLDGSEIFYSAQNTPQFPPAASTASMGYPNLKL